MFKEFKDFAMRGNLVDLAVGFILGGAFSTIVKSLVNDIIMPPLGLLLGGVDFTDLFVPLDGGDYESLEAANEAGAPVIAWGLFVNNVISFVIMALALFFLIKGMNSLRKKQEEAPAEAPPPPRSEQLLAEIRDLLQAPASETMAPAPKTGSAAGERVRGRFAAKSAPSRPKSGG